MSDEVQTARSLSDDIIARRGGAECFSPEQLRLVHALVHALARPAEIDPVLVERLTSMLPRPVSVPEPEANEHVTREAMIAPLRKLYRHLHEQVAALTTENAELRAALGLKGFPQSGEMFKAAITPPTSDIVPPNERAECDTGPRPGPDDPPPRSTRVIEGKANPPAANAAPAPEPWQDWLDRGGYGGPGYDRWSDNRR